MEKISAVFFDFDGVLIDSLPAMKPAWESVQSNFNVDVDFENYSKFIGLPFEDILENLSINRSIHKEIKSHYSKIAVLNRRRIKLNPYTRKILDWLKLKNIRTAIVTSKDLTRTTQLVEMFDIDIDLIITPEQTKQGKPHPEPILHAAKLLGLQVNEIIFVGDMLSDMKCAQSANCYYLHYLEGYQRKANIIYGGIISSLIEIKEYILNF